MSYQYTKFKFLLVVLLLIVFVSSWFFAMQAKASVANGTIDSSNKYARICKNVSCSVYGTVNWKPTLNADTNGATAVAVTDSGITGHLWGDEIGWINLAPTGAGLSVNSSTGVITGKAYSSVSGWINFSSTGQSVTLVDNGSGSNFYGWAWVSGINGGWLKFDCASATTCVKTDWRATSYRTVVENNDGGSSSPSPTPPPAETPPLDTVPPAPTPAQDEDSNNDSNSENSQSSNGLNSQVSTNTPVDFNLSATQMIPNEVYVGFADGKINFPVKKGNFFYKKNGIDQQFDGEYYRVPVGKNLTFSFKPAKAVKSVKLVVVYLGPLVDTRKTLQPRWTIWDRIKDILNIGQRNELSWLGLKTVNAQEGAVELDFNLDSDGVYRRNYEAKDNPGLYEIKTKVEYQDGTTEEIPNTSIVFDEGESFGIVDRIFDTVRYDIVSLITVYQKNDLTGEFEKWNAEFYDQSNPLYTDEQGNYSAVVMPGTYKIKAEAEGYYDFISDEFIVGVDDRIINHRVAMIGKFWGSFGFMWPVKLAVVLILLVILGMIGHAIKKRVSST